MLTTYLSTTKWSFLIDRLHLSHSNALSARPTLLSRLIVTSQEGRQPILFNMHVEADNPHTITQWDRKVCHKFSNHNNTLIYNITSHIYTIHTNQVKFYSSQFKTSLQAGMGVFSNYRSSSCLSSSSTISPSSTLQLEPLVDYTEDFGIAIAGSTASTIEP